MKSSRSLWPVQGIPLAFGLLAAIASSTFAQTNTSLPIVRIRGTDGYPSESGHTGAFIVSRDGGGTNDSLRVFYLVSGSASNGVDYVALSNSVTIAAGAFTASVPIIPIDDTLVEGPETVELRLVPSSAGVLTYQIGSPSNAVLVIQDNDFSNFPPTVRIV